MTYIVVHYVLVALLVFKGTVCNFFNSGCTTIAKFKDTVKEYGMIGAELL